MGKKLFSKDSVRATYFSIIILLAILSIILSILDFANKINLDKYPYNIIDDVILIVFSIDYFGGLLLSKQKWSYVKTHVFDLLAIIPYTAFSAFKIFRIFKLFKVFRLFRFVGLAGKLNSGIKRFLKTNGFIYLFLICSLIIFISGALYSFVENVSFPNAIWWAITTSTTVGYGDISPKTGIGKVLAVILMLVGISFVGMLTSTFTAFFTHDDNDDSPSQKINEYFELYKKGAISLTEYKKIKGEILNKELK